MVYTCCNELFCLFNKKGGATTTVIMFYFNEAGLTGFLRRWGIQLSALFLQDNCRTATTKEILLLTPELDELALHGIPDIADVFESLTRTEMQEL